MQRFLAVIANKRWSPEPMGESYQKYLRSFKTDNTHGATLLFAAAMLMTSAVFTLF